MNNMTNPPTTWLSSLEKLPLLAEVVGWEALREWGLSDVWRITTREGKTWIAKHSRGSMAVELAIYHEVLSPLNIIRPALHSYYQTETENFFILEDLGCYTLEMRPQTEFFMEAARVLAQFRCSAAQQLVESQMTIPAKYFTPAEYYVHALESVLQQDRLDRAQKQILTNVATWLPEQLSILYRDLPFTLCHNDYHVKNLVIRGDSVVPVDWAMAYISPFMGDFYALLRGAIVRKIDRSLIINAYEDELQRHAALPCVRQLQSQPLEWQIALGGVCILITSMHWIFREAMYELPESIEWIPRLLKSIEKCVQQLH
jgi:Phosphotransferase enzyme family